MYSLHTFVHKQQCGIQSVSATEPEIGLNVSVFCHLLVRT